MRSSSAVGLVLLAGCAQDIGIAGDYGLSGMGDAPSLDSPRRQDVIQQTTIPEVDILWVVDNSCSMAEEQRKLANNFDAFIRFFVGSGLDWHVGVVSTDVDAGGHSGKLRPAGAGSQARFLTPEMPDVEGLFANMVDLGTGGSAEEAGLDATWLAIQQPSGELQTTNAGFYRDGAALHVVVISDEEDQSGIRVPEFVTWMKNLKPSADIPMSFSSIVTPKPVCGQAAAIDAGLRYMDVSAQIGGQIESICVADWYPVLEALGLQAAGLKREYFLTEKPVPETITMVIVDDGGERHGIDLDRIPPDAPFDGICRRRGYKDCFGFTYDPVRNSVYLPEYLPGALAQVSIDYELLSGREPGLTEDEETDEALE